MARQAARCALGAGKARHRRRQPAGIQRRPGRLGARRALIGSLNTCTLLTFLTLARGHGVTPVAYDSDAEGLFENVDGTFQMTKATLRPRVTVKSEAELAPAREAMDSVEAHCFIARSITAQVVLEPEFVVG